ncbi:MAG: hypothetical protein K0S65_3281, partial [Labilithrix sp.]|nr:hypothetical protein [Labilithrix sp.]
SAGAANCVSREQVTADIETTLGRPVFAPREVADRVLRVDVATTSPPNRFTGQILLSTAGGVSLGARELAVESEDCKEVSSAFALALSIMADLPRTSAEQVPASTKPQPAGTPARPPQVVPPPSSEQRWRAFVGLGAEGALDSNGSLAPGAQAALVVVPPRFLPFAVAVHGEPRSSSTSDGKGYTLLGTTVAAMMCAPAWTPGRFAWLSCLGPDVTVYLGWGAGFTDSRAGVSSTVGGILQSWGAYSITPRWRAVLGLAAAATPQQVSLASIDRQSGSTTFYRTPLLTAFASIGVAAEIF